MASGQRSVPPFLIQRPVVVPDVTARLTPHKERRVDSCRSTRRRGIRALDGIVTLNCLSMRSEKKLRARRALRGGCRSRSQRRKIFVFRIKSHACTGDTEVTARRPDCPRRRVTDEGQGERIPQDPDKMRVCSTSRINADPLAGTPPARACGTHFLSPALCERLRKRRMHRSGEERWSHVAGVLYSHADRRHPRLV